MPVTFLIGLQWGAIGLAWGWVIAFPLLTLFTFFQSYRHIGINAGQLARAIWPGLSTSIAMAAVVYLADQFMPDMIVYARLAILVAIGGIAYVGLLWLLAKPTLIEAIQLIRRKGPREPMSDPTMAESPS
jgi:hypothetical protein